ncbi:DUF6142 family protein [Acetivibrio ethanolgignens]|uniref:Uncharacterized protein n=1 Tax=Acetivibrio ethanolgignens TaxID=290052 RepID=A0A0V8QFY2_9FIRM|nr:DUF6142 family protein [Acetivibrio ethanolgignens]KSV59493.1 hypothetical protein ASU35_08745 [Acetivibrio ethanolgignens]
MAGNRRVRIPRKARKARSGKYKFSDKLHPVEGITSFCMGIGATVLTVTGIAMSEQAMGQGSLIVGVLGTLAMVFSVIGFGLAVCAFRKKEIHYRFPIMGSILNGILTLFLLSLYVMGAAII